MGRRQLWIRGYVLLVLGVLASFGNVQAQSNTARVRIIHASQDMPPVDILLDGQRVLANVPFPFISDYLDVPAGQRQVAVVPAGQDASAALLTSAATFEAGKAYSVAAVGQKNVAVEVYTDDLSPPPAEKAHVRLIHLSPDAPGANVEIVNGPTLATDLAFTEATAYQAVDAGTYNLRLVATGQNTVIVQLPNTTLEAGKIYTVAATGRLANIQVVTNAVTPVAANQSQQRQGQAALPQAGVDTEHTLILLLVGLLAIVCGQVLRRQARVC
ncbi:MAG: DUF4397 domain-containing protein [Chloroflexota bacterium]|nr:DUF4397 domain-containing protein [Chloroflexota bacterium]